MYVNLRCQTVILNPFICRRLLSINIQAAGNVLIMYPYRKIYCSPTKKDYWSVNFDF